MRLRIELLRGTRIFFELKDVLSPTRGITVTDERGELIAMLTAFRGPGASSLVLARGRYTVTVSGQRGKVERVIPLIVTSASVTVVVGD